jgi:hypothetical protein
MMLGVKGVELTVDPRAMQAKLDARPAVRDELHRIYVDDLDDLLGTYVASASTMRRVTSRFAPVTDDFPIMEYQPPRAQQRPGAILNIFDVSDAAEWCPSCFA